MSLIETVNKINHKTGFSYFWDFMEHPFSLHLPLGLLHAFLNQASGLILKASWLVPNFKKT